jgi:WD40 repeat protein
LSIVTSLQPKDKITPNFYLDGSVVRTWKSLHLTPVVELAFDTTTTLVASGGTDGSLKVWDIRRQYCTHNLKGGSGVYRYISPKSIGDFFK